MYRITSNPIRRRRVYGIIAGRMRIEDISTSRSRVEALAKRCRIEKLSPIHLMDVVQDWVQEQSMI